MSERENRVPMIFSSLTAAAASINAVHKNNKNTQQGWNFRSIDDVYNALSPALIAAGLTIVPRVLDRDIVTEEKIDQNGSKKAGATTARILMQYEVFAQDGSSVIATTLGEGKDFGDKACNKAMAIAYKYMAFQLFCIPTEEMRRDDPDYYVPDEQPEKPKLEPKAAPPQKKATVSKASKVPEAAGSVVDRAAAMAKLAQDMGTDMNGVKTAWEQMQLGGAIPNKPSREMNDDEFIMAVDAMRATFAEAQHG